MQNTVLRSLAPLTAARITRLVIRDRSLTAGLDPVPAGLPLTELLLDNRPPDRNLRGIDRLPTLNHVEFYGTPDREELAALSRLPVLNSLTAHQPDTVDDLARLPALRHLAVDGIPAAEQPAVLATPQQSGHLSITLNGVAIAR